MEKLHPAYANRIRYWHVHDLDVAHPDEGQLPELEGFGEGIGEGTGGRISVMGTDATGTGMHMRHESAITRDSWHLI